LSIRLLLKKLGFSEYFDVDTNLSFQESSKIWLAKLVEFFKTVSNKFEDGIPSQLANLSTSFGKFFSNFLICFIAPDFEIRLCLISRTAWSVTFP